MKGKKFTKSGHFIGKNTIGKVLSRINCNLKLFKRFEHGVINPIYIIKTGNRRELVLRLTNPFWEKRKTLNEVTIIEFLKKKTNIPLPKILDYDLGNSRIGYEYILMEKSPGEPLNKIWKTLSEREKSKILSQIASIIIQLNKFSFKKIGSFKKDMRIGPLSDTNTGPFNNFSEYIASLIESKLLGISEIRRFRKYVPKLRKFTSKIVKKYKKSPILTVVHGDIFGNCLIKDGKITTLLDFEWAHSGSTEEDIHHLFHFGLYYEKSERLWRHFLESLKEKGLRLSKDYDERKVMYEVVMISMTLVAYKHWFPNRPKVAEKYIRGECKKLERIFSKFL